MITTHSFDQLRLRLRQNVHDRAQDLISEPRNLGQLLKCIFMPNLLRLMKTAE